VSVGLDEYGDVPGQGGAQYATMDTMLPDKNLHHSNTGHKNGNITFWFYTSRPEGISVEEWERTTRDKWDYAFSKE
jgi:hypothetical protein